MRLFETFEEQSKAEFVELRYPTRHWLNDLFNMFDPGSLTTTFSLMCTQTIWSTTQQPQWLIRLQMKLVFLGSIHTNMNPLLLSRSSLSQKSQIKPNELSFSRSIRLTRTIQKRPRSVMFQWRKSLFLTTPEGRLTLLQSRQKILLREYDFFQFFFPFLGLQDSESYYFRYGPELPYCLPRNLRRGGNPESFCAITTQLFYYFLSSRGDQVVGPYSDFLYSKGFKISLSFTLSPLTSLPYGDELTYFSSRGIIVSNCEGLGQASTFAGRFSITGQASGNQVGFSRLIQERICLDFNLALANRFASPSSLFFIFDPFLQDSAGCALKTVGGVRLDSLFLFPKTSRSKLWLIRSLLVGVWKGVVFEGLLSEGESGPMKLIPVTEHQMDQFSA